jgi:hypothetical protein
MATDLFTRKTMTKAIWIIFSTVSFILTLIFSLTFITRTRLSYNEEGRYFDENDMVVYHEQAEVVYGLLTIVFLSLTVITLSKAIKRMRTKD